MASLSSSEIAFVDTAISAVTVCEPSDTVTMTQFSVSGVWAVMVIVPSDVELGVVSTV